MKHKHAESMMLFAQDALETDTPWERWEAQYDDCGWESLYGSPQWDTETQYRRKIKTININGYEVPEPIREPLKEGEAYWWVGTGGLLEFHWRKEGDYAEDLAVGFMHYTKEAAEIHREAICSFTKL